MKLAVIMDPIDEIIPQKDGTLDLLLEAQSRSYEITYFETKFTHQIYFQNVKLELDFESTSQGLYKYGVRFEFIGFLIVHILKSKKSKLTKISCGLWHLLRNAKTSLIVVGLLYLSVFLV